MHQAQRVGTRGHSAALARAAPAPSTYTGARAPANGNVRGFAPATAAPADKLQLAPGYREAPIHGRSSACTTSSAAASYHGANSAHLSSVSYYQAATVATPAPATYHSADVGPAGVAPSTESSSGAGVDIEIQY